MVYGAFPIAPDLSVIKRERMQGDGSLRFGVKSEWDTCWVGKEEL